MGKEINRGVEARLLFSTLDRPNGDKVNASAIPTITRIMVDGVQTDITGSTIVQAQDDTPANIAGMYYVIVPTSTLSVNAQVDVIVSANILGIDRTATICFTVVDVTAGTPVIKVC